MMHFLPLGFLVGGGGFTLGVEVSVYRQSDSEVKGYVRTARIASSKTVFRPFCVRAEHSRYFTAPMSLAICTPCEYVMGAMRLIEKT